MRIFRLILRFFSEQAASNRNFLRARTAEISRQTHVDLSNRLIGLLSETGTGYIFLNPTLREVRFSL
jgi:hypothetical protein